MNRKDRFVIAIRNIIVNKAMVKKMIFGMIFVIMILFCIFVIIRSYFEFISRFNEKHIKDCYYYADIGQQELSETALNRLIKQVESEKERYNAKEVSLLCTLRTGDNIQMTAGNTRLVIGGKEYEEKKYFVNNRAIFQNIQWEYSPIELALFKNEFAVFSNTITQKHGENWIKGTYPRNPGEVMIDTHVLEVFGLEYSDDLIGNTISIYSFGENKERSIIYDYLLTGIYDGEILKSRESLTTKDNHFEHIYVNLLAEDETSFVIDKGTKRFYFDDYNEYIKNYEGIDDILKLNLSQKYTVDDEGIQLTGKGMECCILYWVLENIGKLLMLVAGGIGLIITISVMYIYQFYREQSRKYIAMLQNIGMQKRDIISIFSIEILIMIACATLLAIYLSIMFLLILSAIMQQVIDFKMVIDVKVCIISVLVSWSFFYCCFYFLLFSKTYLKNFAKYEKLCKDFGRDC